MEVPVGVSPAPRPDRPGLFLEDALFSIHKNPLAKKGTISEIGGCGKKAAREECSPAPFIAKSEAGAVRLHRSPFRHRPLLPIELLTEKGDENPLTALQKAARGKASNLSPAPRFFLGKEDSQKGPSLGVTRSNPLGASGWAFLIFFSSIFFSLLVPRASAGPIVSIGNWGVFNVQSEIDIPIMVSGGEQIPGVDLYVQTYVPILALDIVSPGCLFAENNCGDGPQIQGTVAANSTLTASGTVASQGTLGILRLDPFSVPRGVYLITLGPIAVNGITLATDFADQAIVPTLLDGSITVLGAHDVIWDGSWSGDAPLTLDGTASVFAYANLTLATLDVDSLTIGGVGATIPEPAMHWKAIAGFFVGFLFGFFVIPRICGEKIMNMKCPKKGPDCPWVVMIQGMNHFGTWCQRCGCEFRISLPVSINVLCAATRAFIKDHRHCVEKSEEQGAPNGSEA